MTKEEKRRELQGEAFEKLVSNHRVICDWGTGVGKSRVAINFIDYLDLIEDKKSILLLVAESTHKLNWRKEFVEALGEERTEELFKNIRMECYASLKKCTDQHYDLIVADEGHHLRSPQRIEYLKQMDAERMLVLSATLSERGDGEALLQALNNVFGDFITLKYEIQQAIDDGVLPTPNIYVIPLQMHDKAENRYDSITEYLEKKKQEYKAATRDDGFFAKTDEELEEMKGKMLHAGSMRKQFLGRLKTRLARRILDDYEASGKRYICFCASIDQVEQLGGVNVITSKQNKKTNKAVIDNFNEGTINSIFAVGMLQEGVSLKNIEAGLLVQLDGKARSFIQKFGRVMRAEDPILKIIYVPESRDEDYLYTALKKVKREYIHGWNPEDYEKKYGLFNMQLISKTTLVGPPAGYDAIRQKYRPYLTEIRGANFVYKAGGQQLQYGNRLRGIYGGIMVDARNGYIFLNIFDKTNRVVYALRTGWKASLGLLMPLCTATDSHHGILDINLTPDGNFAKATLFMNGRELSWCKQTIPQDEPGCPESERLNFINNLILRVDQNYRAGIPSQATQQATPAQQPFEAPQQPIQNRTNTVLTFATRNYQPPTPPQQPTGYSLNTVQTGPVQGKLNLY